jgi:hypothetical protein
LSLQINNVIEELKTSSENSNTRRSTILWFGVFTKWAALRNICEDMETYKVKKLDKFTTNIQINFSLYDYFERKTIYLTILEHEEPCGWRSTT